MRSGHWLIFLVVLASQAAAGPRYSSRIVETKSGPIRGIILELNSGRLEPVEAFLGVKYGSAERFGVAGPAPRWTSTKLADSQPPVCPQSFPDLSNKTAALQFMPKNRYAFLKRLAPLLANQTENCLYLNIYVPGSGLGFDRLPNLKVLSSRDVVKDIDGISYAEKALLLQRACKGLLNNLQRPRLTLGAPPHPIIGPKEPASPPPFQFLQMIN